MDLLILLVERRGQLVTRAEIVEPLWGPDVFVDVETGVHTAIRKVRRALGESPDAPAFLETGPGRATGSSRRSVWRVPARLTAAPASVQARLDVSAPEAVPSNPPTSNRARLATTALVLSVLAGLSAWAWHRPSDVTLAVLPFDNLSGDPEAEYLASGLAEEVMVALGQFDPARVHIVGRTSIMSYKHTTKSRAEISPRRIASSASRIKRGVWWNGEISLSSE
jgi:hypothetical protein